MELRKAQEMGGGTLLVSLPKEWARSYGVSKGDVLQVEDRSDGSLIIQPRDRVEQESSSVVVPYSERNTSALSDQVTSQYLLGVDKIEIRSDRQLTYEERESIKDTVRRLVGLEIIEEDSQSITMQSLLEPRVLNLERLLLRMHTLTLSMQQDAMSIPLGEGEHLARIVVERDDEIDRLYFLLVRLIRSAIQTPSLLDRLGIDPIDCLDYRVASNLLERIGDSAAELARHAVALSELSYDAQFREDFREMRELMEEIQEVAVRGFLEETSRSSDVDRIYEEIRSILDHVDSHVLEEPSRSAVKMLYASSSVKTICQCNVDVADLVSEQFPSAEQ